MSPKNSDLNEVHKRGNDFEKYCHTWLSVAGHEGASKWLAFYVGKLVGEVELLKRRLNKLEGKGKK